MFLSDFSILTNMVSKGSGPLCTLYVVGVELNRTNFKLIFIEFFKYYLPFRINESQIFESNQTNFEWIQIDSTSNISANQTWFYDLENLYLMLITFCHTDGFRSPFISIYSLSNSIIVITSWLNRINSWSNYFPQDFFN